MHPAAYFPNQNEYDFAPHSPYPAVPVTPQTQIFGSNQLTSPGQHQADFEGQINESDPRKRQRCEVDINNTSSQSKDSKPTDDQDLTKDVEYILAQHLEKLGFPVYNGRKEIVGFYREAANEIGVGRFFPLSQNESEFSARQKEEATRVLEEAIARKSAAVHSIKDWGSLSSMLDHAMVYDWSKDFGGHA